ncbi:MAG: hypothetical protein IJY16_09625 [Clostridia bacterium]|nr:hypothetical protein [Clostridia bacterium]
MQKRPPPALSLPTAKKFTSSSPKTFKKKEERCEQSKKTQTVDLFWFIVGV